MTTSSPSSGSPSILEPVGATVNRSRRLEGANVRLAVTDHPASDDLAAPALEHPNDNTLADTLGPGAHARRLDPYHHRVALDGAAHSPRRDPNRRPAAIRRRHLDVTAGNSAQRAGHQIRGFGDEVPLAPPQNHPAIAL